MGYTLMISLINGEKKDYDKLVKYANVYLAANQMTPEQYTEVMDLIETKFNNK